MHRLPAFALSLLLVLLLLAPARGEEERLYTVKLHRPDHKGAKFDVNIAGAVRQQTRMKQQDADAPEPTDHLFGVELEGTVEINDVDERGNATRATYTVERCVRVEDNQDQQILPRGSVFIAEAGERDTSFSLKDGGELTDEQKSALDIVASLPRKGAPTADELFGTSEKQKVGASWPVNVNALVEDARTFGMTFDKAKTSGTVKLAGIEKEEGVDFLHITADTKVDSYKMELPKDWKLPPGMAFESGTIQMSFDGLLPVDPEGTQANVSNTYTRTMLFEGKVNDRTTTIEMKTTQMVQLRAVPMKE